MLPVVATGSSLIFNSIISNRLAKPYRQSDGHIATNCARRAPVRLDLTYNIVMKFFETGSVGACRNSVSANRLMSHIGQ